MRILIDDNWLPYLGAIKEAVENDAEIYGILSNRAEELERSWRELPIFKSVDDIDDGIELVFLEGEFVTKENLEKLAKKKCNVICSGFWILNNYLEILKTFRRERVFILEREVFKQYQNVETLIKQVSTHISEEEIYRIEFHLNKYQLFNAFALLQMFISDSSRLTIVNYCETEWTYWIEYRLKKNIIVFEINKQILKGLEMIYSPINLQVSIQTARGNFRLEGLAGSVYWEGMYPVNGNYNAMNGYFFAPITKNFEQGCDDYHSFLLEEEKIARIKEIKEIIMLSNSKGKMLVKMQQQALYMKQSNNLLSNIGGDHVHGEYMPMLWKEKPEVSLCDMEPEHLFDSYRKNYLAYSVRQRNSLIAKIILMYLNKKNIFDEGISYTMDEICKNLQADGESMQVIIKWIKLLIQFGYVSEVQQGVFMSKEKFKEDDIRKSWKEMEFLWSNQLESPLVLNYLKNNIKNWDLLIQKKKNATHLLFNEGGDDYAEALYKETKILYYENAKLAKCIERGLGDTENELVIFEIGSGTGSATDVILEHIDCCGNDKKVTYYYTDISKYFLHMAKERYQRYADNEKINIKYQIFDIEKSFFEQIESDLKVDIVVAVGVLNNSSNTDKCIKQISQMLKKGGKLYVAETVVEVPDILISQAFMMTPPQDIRKKKDRMFLTRDEWIDILENMGFCEISEFPEQGNYLEILGQKLFCCTKR